MTDQTGRSSPASGVISDHESVALTCEVGGDPVWTTVSRHVVTTLLTTVLADATKRDHVREHVVRTGRKPSSLGRKPDSDVTGQNGCEPTSFRCQPGPSDYRRLWFKSESS